MQLVLPEKKMRLLVETVMMVLQPACMLTLLFCEQLGLAEKFNKVCMANYPCEQAGVQIGSTLGKVV